MEDKIRLLAPTSTAGGAAEHCRHGTAIAIHMLWLWGRAASHDAHIGRQTTCHHNAQEHAREPSSEGGAR